MLYKSEGPIFVEVWTLGRTGQASMGNRHNSIQLPDRASSLLSRPLSASESKSALSEMANVDLPLSANSTLQNSSVELNWSW